MLITSLQETDEGDAAFSATVGGFEAESEAASHSGHGHLLRKVEDEPPGVSDPWSEGKYHPPLALCNV